MTNRTTIEIVGGDALVTTGDHRLYAVPRDRSGADAGCPLELLEAALGACVALTLDAVARNKGIDIPNLKVQLSRQPDGSGGIRFAVNIDLGPGLTDREQKILYRSASLCDVSKILTNNVPIDYRLLDTT